MLDLLRSFNPTGSPSNPLSEGTPPPIPPVVRTNEQIQRDSGQKPQKPEKSLVERAESVTNLQTKALLWATNTFTGLSPARQREQANIWLAGIGLPSLDEVDPVGFLQIMQLDLDDAWYQREGAARANKEAIYSLEKGLMGGLAAIVAGVVDTSANVIESLGPNPIEQAFEFAASLAGKGGDAQGRPGVEALNLRKLTRSSALESGSWIGLQRVIHGQTEIRLSKMPSVFRPNGGQLPFRKE